MRYENNSDRKHAYQIFGCGKIDLVIEMGLGATAGEWWHIAELFSSEYTVLLYERNRKIAVDRTPQNIAKELYQLLKQLDCAEKITLLAHSQGGLYAQQFARLYPHMVTGILLIDPLSANDNKYKTLLTPEEQKKSGFDKTGNLVLMSRLAKLPLGFFIKAVMKKAPPFYYYPHFSADASDYILSSLTKSDLYTAALEEYRLAHEEKLVGPLKEKTDFPDVPLVLITHTREFSVREMIEFGHTSEKLAMKAEDIWQSLIKEYLAFSNKTKYLQAKNSGHYIHLTEPDLIDDGLLWIGRCTKDASHEADERFQPNTASSLE
jgi:Predicted hydrolases or acyltransferases (alpha/beta hydrolase superfamily)